MVVDNVDDGDMFFGLKRLSELLPWTSNGSIIFTTRNKQIGVDFVTSTGIILLSGLDPIDGERLLVSRSGQSLFQNGHMTELLSYLDHLPLAICQAGSYMAKRTLSISDYLRLYNESERSKIDLLNKDFEDCGRTCDTKPSAVALTWRISFDQIRQNDPLAARLFSLMACLDRQHIPKALFTSIGNKQELADSFGLLQAYSLITADASHDYFDMHRLVHLCSRNWLESEDKSRYFVGLSLELISRHFPSPSSQQDDLATCNLYWPHADSILSHELSLLEDEARASLAFRVSIYLQIIGNYEDAEKNAENALHWSEKVSGKRSQGTLTKLSNLAIIHRYQGRYQSAKEFFEEVLDGRQETLGNKHPETLASLSNLALILNDTGNFEAAENLYRKACIIQKKELGHEHADTLMTMSNLAISLQSQQNYKAAEEIFRKVLSGRKRSLGMDHLDTLSSFSNLGVVLQLQGHLSEAEKMDTEALQGRERILGKNHPETLECIGNLGCVLHDKGQFGAAEDHFRRALDGYKTCFRANHPITLRTLSNLAIMIQRQGRDQEAEEISRQVLNSEETCLVAGAPGCEACCRISGPAI
jgi:tetratricopeptide (TPR) repeat protein